MLYAIAMGQMIIIIITVITTSQWLERCHRHDTVTNGDLINSK